MKRHLLRAILLLLFFVLPVSASAPQKITWTDLLPVIDYDDPFLKLTAEQSYHLSLYARIMQMKDAGSELSDRKLSKDKESEQFLIEEKVDIDGLLAKRDEVTKMRQRMAVEVVPELDGKAIVMPGFVLPLEYDGKKVTELLLVPWVGACIHTPPPPPNQIVHVVMADGQAREIQGFYEPVNVTGTIYTKSLSKSLYLLDGAAEININYTMQASRIEPFNPSEETQDEGGTE